jgi:hypothetical protein
MKDCCRTRTAYNSKIISIVATEGRKGRTLISEPWVAKKLGKGSVFAGAPHQVYLSFLAAAKEIGASTGFRVSVKRIDSAIKRERELFMLERSLSEPYVPFMN